MPSESMPVEIAIAPRFQKNLKKLSKRYRHIRSDIEPLIEQLKSGRLPGDQIVGLDLVLFKVRVKNSDIQKGKSAGYRAIYYVKTPHQVILITIYSKSDQTDVEVSELREILSEYEQSFD